MSDAPADDYALTKGTQAHRLARWMLRVGWVSQLRAAIELHIPEIHPRLPDISRAGGAYKMRTVGAGSESWAEYTITQVPRIRGWSEDARAAYNALLVPVPEDAPSGFIPPPRADKDL